MFLYKSYIFYMDLISKWTKYNIGRILWKNEQKCFSSENTNLIETQTIHKWSFETRWVVQTQVSGTDSGEWYRLMWVVQTQMSGTDSGEWYTQVSGTDSGDWYTQMSGTDSGEWYRLRWMVQTQMNGTDSGEWYRLGWVVQTQVSI
jgi:hypothetical protein